MNRELHFSTGNDEHDTPIEIFKPISEAVGGFDLDPAASPTSDLATTNLTKKDDGLEHEWNGKVWLNPPYSQLTSHDWMDRVVEHDDLVVGLFPNRTSTRWYQGSVPYSDLVCHVDHRIRFAGSDNSAPFPSVIVGWHTNGYYEALKPVFDEIGSVFKSSNNE